MRDLAGIIVKVLGRDVALTDGSETPGSPVRRCPDTSLLEELTGYVAPTSLEEGIRETYEWYKPRLDQRYE